MINIMHIVLGLQVGGLEKFVLDLVKHYPDDIKPYIVCLEKKGDLGAAQGRAELIELSKKPGVSVELLAQLTRLIKELKIDVLHTHNPAPHFYGSISGLLTGRPVIHTKHGRNYPGNSRKVWLNRISSLLSSKVVAVSRNAADVCLDVERVPRHKVQVILNGVDTRVFRPPYGERSAAPGPVRVGIVARLSKEKDHETLLAACQMLAARTTAFHLEVIGDGPLRSSLEEAVARLGLQRQVSFHGMRNDVPELLRDLDVFVLSSITEGISLTLLEAMSTELPVVATEVGGNPEVVMDGETGYLVPARDPFAMADRLFQLVSSPPLRRRLGINGRRRVLEHFSMNETAKGYETLYRTVVRP